MFDIVSFIPRAVVQGIPLLFGCTGETLTEKSGNLNLGIPGIMYVGGICGVIGAFLYEQSAGSASAMNPVLGVLIPLLACLIGSLLMGLLYCFLTVTLRANQNVTGLTITIFGSGIANFYGGYLNKLAGGVGQISVATTSAVFRARLPFATSLGTFGNLFLSYGFMVYLAVALAVFVQFFFNRTRKGLALRAVGEDPATADAAGISVTKYKYLATCLGAGISGLGGLYYVMDYIKGTWANDEKLEALGWLAVALVIFATWKTAKAIWGAYLFGILYWMYLYIPGLTRSSQELFKMLPYLVTLIVLIVSSLRKKREQQPPASLGLAYFREER